VRGFLCVKRDVLRDEYGLRASVELFVMYCAVRSKCCDGRLRVLRAVFGPKRVEVTGGWGKYMLRCFIICTAVLLA